METTPLSSVYRSRLARRGLPIVAAAVLVLLLIALAFITEAHARNLTQTHRVALAETRQEVQATMGRYVSDMSKLAAQDSVISLGRALSNQAYSSVADLFNSVVASDADYLRLRLLDETGNGIIQTVRRDGVPETSGFAAGQVADDLDLAFDAALRSDQRQVFFGGYRDVLTSEGNRIAFSLYQPVIPLGATAQPVGVLELTIALEGLQALVLAPPAERFEAVPDRRLLLMDTAQDVVLADNGGNPLYIDNITNPAGNIAGDDFYTGLREAALEQQAAMISQYTISQPITAEALNSIWDVPFASSDSAWTLAMHDNPAVVNQPWLITIAAVTLATLLGLALFGVYVFRMVGRTLAPIDTAQDIALQALSEQPPVHRTGSADHDPLSGAISQLSAQVDELRQALVRQSRSTQTQMEVASRIGRQIVAIGDLNDLLDNAIELICNELGYYHAQVFLVDSAGINAVLVRSRGAAGQRLIEQGHRLAIGSRTVVGRVTASGQPVLVNDVNAPDSGHAFNPLLPETRAEMALPLVVGEQVIGALDVQSTETNAFDPASLIVYQLLADQLASAVYSAQLRRDAETRLHEVDQLNRRLMREAWQDVQPTLGGAHSLSYDLITIRAIDEQIPDNAALTVPISVRGQMIGTLSASLADGEGLTEDDALILRAVADRVALAVENARLFQEAQTALDDTATLYRATTMTSRTRGQEELAAAMREVLAGLNPDLYAVVEKTVEGEIIDILAVSLDGGDGGLIDREALLRLPLGNTVVADRAGRNPASFDALEAAVFCDPGIESFALVPLSLQEVQAALVLVAYRAPHRFTERELRLIGALADSAAVVLANQTLLGQVEETLIETTTIYQAGEQLALVRNNEDLAMVAETYLAEEWARAGFTAILGRAGWFDDYSLAQVAGSFAFDEKGQPATPPYLAGEQLTTGRLGAAWELLATPELLLIGDIHAGDADLTEEQRAALEAMAIRSLAVLPLKTQTRAYGAIWMSSDEPHAFTERDVRVYESFTDQASLTVEANRSLIEAETRSRQLATSAEVSQAAAQIMDLETLFSQVVDLIRDRFGYDHAQIFLMDEAREYAVLEASTGEAGQQLLAIEHKLARGSASVIGRVTETGQPALAQDTEDADVVHRPNPYLPLTRCELAVPITKGREVIGAIDVQSNLPNAFGQEDIQALQTLAGQISIAIDNANLYENIASRANELAFLFDVTSSAAASEDLDEALENVAIRLLESLDALDVAIYLPKEYVDSTTGESITRMEPATLVGSEQPVTDLEAVRVGDIENLIGFASTTLNPELIPDVRTEMRYAPIDAGARSAIVLPLYTSDTAIGVIVVESDQVRGLTRNTLQLLMAMSGSVTGVMQNARLLDQLQQSNEQLRELDRLKSQFLANMSHELRTPLNSIIGFSRVMLKGIDGELNEMQEQDLTTIYNSGNHLLTLINDILDQAKIESGKLDIKTAYFDIQPTIEAVRAITLGLIKDKPIDLFVNIEPNLPQAYGDEFRSRQILLNLANNASKFTPEGSITINAHREVRAGQTFVRVDVVDTGIGVEEASIPMLFETFRQVDSSLTRTAGGTGLGLPISRSLAEMQGGALLVESIPGQGSTFTVLLPTDPAVDEAVPEAAPDEARPARRHTQPNSSKRLTQPIRIRRTRREILMIEDNKDMVDTYRRFLQREGYDVQTADHPAYAEAMVSTLQPTLILLDVNFGEGAGWAILERLGQREDSTDIPIVVATLSDERERIMSLGAKYFLQRPFVNSDLLEVVQAAERDANRERILIIDDHPDSHRLLREVIGNETNYRIYSASSGEEGIALVARRHPDLILLDLRMPHMDGFAVLHELRGNPETAAIPIVVVTGEVPLSDVERATLAGMSVHVKSVIDDENAARSFIDDLKSHLSITM
jgi:signal transduction histidine kinase/DNA-binding response OmpR family regulator/uncharacterized protein YigA (DUF484 family)